MTDRKPHSLRLPAELDLDLRAFAEANFGGSMNQIMIEALRRFIAAELDASPRLRHRYTEARYPSGNRSDQVLRMVSGGGVDDEGHG